MDELLTLEEVAKRYRIAPATLRWWRTRGRGEGPKSARIGRRVMYRRSDCDAWVQSCFDAQATRDAS